MYNNLLLFIWAALFTSGILFNVMSLKENNWKRTTSFICFGFALCLAIVDFILRNGGFSLFFKELRYFAQQ